MSRRYFGPNLARNDIAFVKKDGYRPVNGRLPCAPMAISCVEKLTSYFRGCKYLARQISSANWNKKSRSVFLEVQRQSLARKA